MSSYIVDKITIDRIVTHIYSQDKRKIAAYYPDLFKAYNGDPDMLGQNLWEMNVEAVNQRYNEANKAERYTFEPAPASKIQVFKSLSCFLYQCTEGNVPEWPLYKDLKMLKYHLACEIVTGLKEYEEAEWG